MFTKQYMCTTGSVLVECLHEMNYNATESLEVLQDMFDARQIHLVKDDGNSASEDDFDPEGIELELTLDFFNSPNRLFRFQEDVRGRELNMRRIWTGGMQYGVEISFSIYREAVRLCPQTSSGTQPLSFSLRAPRRVVAEMV